MIKMILDNFKYLNRLLFAGLLRPFNQKFTSFKQQASPKKIIGGFVSKITKRFNQFIKGKTSSKEDYVEFSRFYVAKKLLVIVGLALIAFGVLTYLVIIPFFISNFGVKKFILEDKSIAKYNGRVIIYQKDKKTKYFEGELANGKETGKGILYDSKGNILYQGMFLNGKKDGKGKLIENEVKLYEGEFSGNKITGNGEKYNNGVLLFKGTFDNGELNGKGTEYYKNSKSKYVGDFVKGVFEGVGELHYESGKLQYLGDFKKGMRDGVGKEYYENGNLKYEGNFKNDLYEGDGVSYYENKKLQYQGAFSQGKYNGKGLLNNDKGLKVYEGDFANSQYSGKGTMFFDNGTVKYQGGFLANLFSGDGILYKEDGKKIYEGQFIENLYSGDGKQFENENLLFEGAFLNNNYEGEGKLYYKDSLSLRYEGIFKQSKFNGNGKYYNNVGKLIFEGNFLEGGTNLLSFFDFPIEKAKLAFKDSYTNQIIENQYVIISKELKCAMYSTKEQIVLPQVIKTEPNANVPNTFDEASLKLQEEKKKEEEQIKKEEEAKLKEEEAKQLATLMVEKAVYWSDDCVYGLSKNQKIDDIKKILGQPIISYQAVPTNVLINSVDFYISKNYIIKEFIKNGYLFRLYFEREDSGWDFIEIEKE